MDDLKRWLQSKVQCREDNDSAENTPSLPKIHVLNGINSDSGHSPSLLPFHGDEEFRSYFDGSVLYNILADNRAVKSEEELKVNFLTQHRFAVYLCSVH